MRWRDWLPFGKVPEISPEEVARRCTTGPPLQILDVRTAAEFAKGHVAGAVHVPVHALSSSLPTLALDPHIEVVAVCKTAHRSIPAVRLLEGAGFAARQLEGGMDGWRRRGLPVTTDAAPDGDRS